jgi:DNA-binding helix-hairpin-helix protein with protein kinase domain
MKNIFDREGKPIILGPVVGRGGEAVVYSLPGNPSRIAKIYEPAPRPNYPAKLAWMLNNPPVDPTAARGHPSLAWPAALLYDQDQHLAGYMMPFIKGAAPILVVFNPRRRSETLPQFDRRYLHRTACNLATAIGALHQSNYVIGDLNESNILVKPSALVSLIDIDSFQVQEKSGSRTITYACPVAKPEYTPPELQGKTLSSVVRTSEQDAFGMGVLIFQLLMEGNHPFRAQWLGKGDPPPLEERIASGAFPYTATPGLPVRPPKYAPELDWLHPALTELIRRCFVDGHRDPHQRPGASAWARAIAESEKCLVLCPHGHVYSDHLPACPSCHAGRVTSRGAAKSTTAS